MANYKKELQPIGYTWAEPVQFNFGPAAGIIRFHVIEQYNIIIDANGSSTNIGQNYVEQGYDPDLIIPVLDPVTLNPTEQTITFKQLYEYLYSLYIKTAIERDERNLQISPPTPS